MGCGEDGLCSKNEGSLLEPKMSNGYGRVAPSHLPPGLRSMRLSPPPAGSVRPQSEGASQRGRRGSAVHRSASRRGVRPGMGKKSPTTPVRTNLGKRNCVFWPLQCWGGGNVSSGCQIFFWYPRRGPRPLPPALKAPARTIAFFRAGPTLPPPGKFWA